MTEEEFLNSDLLKTPIIRTTDNFPEFVACYLHKYLTMINSADGDFKNNMADRIFVIRDLIYNFIYSIDPYYLGNVNKVYQTFRNGLTLITQYLWMDDLGVTVSK